MFDTSKLFGEKKVKRTIQLSQDLTQIVQTYEDSAGKINQQAKKLALEVDNLKHAMFQQIMKETGTEGEDITISDDNKSIDIH